MEISLLFQDKIVDIMFAVFEATLAAREKSYMTHAKVDGSIVTSVDFLADDIIKDHLSSLFPNIPIVSEENSEEENEFLLSGDARRTGLFLVDPVDGTYSMVRGGEYCVNISYMENNIPVLGSIGIPTRGEVFYTTDSGVNKATKNEVISLYIPNTCKLKRSSYAMITNHRNILKGDRLLSAETIREYMLELGYSIDRTITGVAAIKYCMFLENIADFVIAFGKFMVWDLSAAYAMLAKVGVDMVDEFGNRISFDNRKTASIIVACPDNDVKSALLYSCSSFDRY